MKDKRTKEQNLEKAINDAMAEIGLNPNEAQSFILDENTGEFRKIVKKKKVTVIN